MPILLDHRLDRRSFLKTATLGGAAVVLSGCRSVTPTSSAGGPECHLALVADTHIPGDRVNGHRGSNPWENLRAIVPSVVAARPDGVLLCGDAARLEGKLEDYRELQALLEPVAAVAPVCIGLGNHDDRTNFLEAFRKAPGNRPPIDGKHVTVIEHDTVRVIVLDSLLYPNKVAGLLGRNQRDWLAEYLPVIRDRPVVLAVHHTLGDGDGDLLDADRLFALLRPHRHVQAVFYGHSHVWQLGKRDGIHLINLPAAGYNFRDQDPVGWVEARFRSRGVTLTLHASAGNREEDGKATTLGWR
jgi:3',5'-cyclic AMP phosphodiesterase CpdA